MNLIPLRVLFVEDSEDDTVIILHHLRKGGWLPKFDRVETSEAMRDKLESKDWDLIIADYNMPNFSGLMAVSVLKSMGKKIPLILVSGEADESIVNIVLRAGARNFVDKHSLENLKPILQKELKNLSYSAPNPV